MTEDQIIELAAQYLRGVSRVDNDILGFARAILAAQHPSQSAGDFVPPHCDPDREDVFAEPTSQSAGEPVAWRLERRNTITGEWQVDLQEGWADGQPLAELVRSVSENAENYRFKFAYASPPPTDAARVSGDGATQAEVVLALEGLCEFNEMAGMPTTRARQVLAKIAAGGIATPAEPDAARVEADRRDAEPSLGLLMSMAIRFDHALGCPGYYDDPAFGDPEPGAHERRVQSTLRTMRQLWEEVVGKGFYRPENEAVYAALAAERNHDSGMEP